MQVSAEHVNGNGGIDIASGNQNSPGIEVNDNVIQIHRIQDGLGSEQKEHVVDPRQRHAGGHREHAQQRRALE